MPTTIKLSGILPIFLLAAQSVDQKQVHAVFETSNKKKTTMMFKGKTIFNASFDVFAEI